MFVDRVPATLAHLRHDLPHSALAVLLRVDRSTVSAAIRQVRPLLAARGFAVPDRIRLRTIEDVFAYAEAEDVKLRIDSTGVQVRRLTRSRIRDKTPGTGLRTSMCTASSSRLRTGTTSAPCRRSR